MINELHFTAYGCHCREGWGTLFPANERGEVDGDLLVKLKTTGEGLFYFDLLFRGEIQLRISCTLEYTATAEAKGGASVYSTGIVYAHPNWLVKSFQIHTAVIQKKPSGNLAIVFSDIKDENLFGLDVAPHGLTTEPATQGDTVH